MDSLLLKLNETTLLFIKPPEMDPQIVQVTLKTPSSRPTVNQLAEFHLSQARISQALIRVIQADMILCASGDGDKEGSEDIEKEVAGVLHETSLKGKTLEEAGKGKGKMMHGMKAKVIEQNAAAVVASVPVDFVVRDEGFEIRCHKQPWAYPLDRWTFFAGEKEVRAAVHKWHFQLNVVEA